MKVLSAETNLSSATNVSSASVVRIFNSDSSVATVTKKDSGGSTIGSFTISAGEVVYSEKNYTDTLEGGSGLKVSKVSYSHMMSYSSYTSSGGGGGGSSIITTNLVLHLDAGNSSSYSGSGTTWSDISGNNNNFTLTNGPTYTSDNGGAIVFDGTNDYANAASDATFFKFGTNDYSFGAWVKFNATPTNFKSVMSAGGSSSYGTWQMDWHSGKLRHTMKNTSGSVPTDLTLITTLNPSLNIWYYLFVVNDRSENELKFYINGTLDTTHSDAGYGSINIGASSGYNDYNIATNRGKFTYLDSSIAQAHVYNGKALTASEVLQNYNATKATFGY